MASDRLTPVLWLAGYAAATFLSFPVGGGGFDIGFAVAWLGPACLLIGLRGVPPGRAARLAFVAALAGHTAVLHWIYVVTVTYGHASPFVGVIAPVGLAAYLSAHTALFAAAVAWLRPFDATGARRWAGPFLVAALWTAVDHLRSVSLSGFPWATLGYAQHANPALLGLAPLGSVYALSFTTVLGGAGLALLWRERGSRPGLVAWAAVALLHALGLGVGLATAPDGDAPRVRIGVLQGNIDQDVKWNPEWAERTLAIYEDLSRRAAADGAVWIVWPETAVPGSVHTDPSVRARLETLASETGATLVVGGVGVVNDDSGRRFFDSAFVVDAGGVRERYDKAHLVPFGEYVPLRDLLGRVFSAVARGIASADVSAGSGPRALALPTSDGSAVPAGVTICYELLFPDLVRGFVGDGAQVLLAITNDAWYGRTGAPHQFLAITALRSAENRVWTARAANTGISGFIDARGRVRVQSRIFERGYLMGDVPLRAAAKGGSFYTRRGDVWAWSCWIGVAVAAAVGRRSPSPRLASPGRESEG